MSWLDLPRVPEPEVMDDGGEVEAYSSAAAQAYLSEIDDTLVEHATRLLAGRSAAQPSGRALDIGAGPGQIARKLAVRLPGWGIVGIDRAPNMIRQALACREGAASSVRAGAEADDGPAPRVTFLLADGCRMPFADESFDLVLCNSVLHHVDHPAALLSEIARVAKRTGAILLRDLRRPSRLMCPWHVRWYGRRYSGVMYKLYAASVRAAYQPAELAAMLHAAHVPGARVFTYRRTHLGIERAAG